MPDVAARFLADEPDAYTWAVEHQGHCIGGTGLRVNRDQHRAAFWIGLFVAGPCSYLSYRQSRLYSSYEDGRIR
jgi:hypothetical protein